MRLTLSESAASEPVRDEQSICRRLRGKFLLGAIIGVSLVGLTGCSTDATIDGTVNWGGGPVEYGSIAFEPKDTTQKKVVATIDKGRFEAHGVSKGPSVIRISVGERPKGPSGSLIGTNPTGTFSEISKSEKNISGGSQTLKFNLKAG
jgi:hypothetical protein